MVSKKIAANDCCNIANNNYHNGINRVIENKELINGWRLRGWNYSRELPTATKISSVKSGMFNFHSCYMCFS